MRVLSGGPTPAAHSTRARVCLSAALLGVIFAAASVAAGTSATQYHAYRSLRGSLVRAETTFVGVRGRYRAYRVRLGSSTGLVVTGRMLAPPSGGGHYPAVLLNDGRELNSAALNYLPAEFGDAVVLSVDYPRELPFEIDVGTFLRRGAQLREAVRRIPADFSLAAMYLAQRSDVDSARIALVATSFAVPFGVLAAAMDARFRNVSLVYGAGDMPKVLAANLTLKPRALRTLVAWLVMRPFREFEPTRHAARIAPRPLIMINGVDDPQMPREAVLALCRAARAPKRLIWLRTGHLMPDDAPLIRQLVDTALARLPVLRHDRGSRTAPDVGIETRGAGCPATVRS